jgi:excisionase family DNA binding protein
MSEQLHTVQQAAEQLKLHPKTVLRLIHEGRLKGARIGKSYRILDSDLRAFAGMADGERSAAGPRARVTCVAEVENVSVDEASRIAGVLGAVLSTREPRPDPVHLTTAYDPETRKLKAVLFAAPADAAAWLRLLQVQLEHLR